MVHLHPRYIRAGEPCRTGAQQPLGDFLAHHESSVGAAQVFAEAAGALEDVPPDRHVGAKRDLAGDLVANDGRPVVLYRDGAPEITAGEVEPRRWRRAPDWTDEAP